jgi:nitrile hydratase
VSARFAAGDCVRVAVRETRGHVRTPGYIRGKRGIVERVCGAFRNPEMLAYGNWDGPAVPLYRVRFELSEVWGASGTPHDTIDVEIYEHWLEAEDTP